MIHLTLTTGHARNSPRDEVDRHILALCEDAILPALLAGQRARLPRSAGYYLTGAANDGGLVATAWTDIDGQRAPIATWWTTADRASATPLWSVAQDHCRQVAQVTRQPAPTAAQPSTVPWVAAWIEVGAILAPEALHWIADLERCLAWAWVDHHRRRTCAAP